MKDIIIKKMDCLSKSKFRSSFRLKNKDIDYINDKGINKIREHAYDFVIKRLAGSVIENDGKQIPMRGHSVNVSQHATATCCRACLYKWHGILKNKELTDEEIDYIVNVMMMWINNQIKNNLKSD